MKKNIIITGVLSLLSITIIGSAFAGEDEQTKLRNRIAELEQQIKENQEEYKGISESLATDRSYCELAKAKETQLSRLNGSNNAKRTEMEILTNLLKDDSIVSSIPSAPLN